ncbi:MAG TPA: SAM-dependent chlorinase/fluorinase, partial [Gemmataceae bacterium]|nr:SAM-dependent chlorinase/fluorinase [Gemmataceae bacterium]
LLVPDNGCWTLLARGARPPLVYRVSEPRFWRQPVSATFHGRDIFAPVAAHLSLGVAPAALGPPVTEWVALEGPAPQLQEDRLSGQVEFIDHFGNLITNIPGQAFTALAGRPVRILVGGQDVPRQVRTYADAEAGSVVALVSSNDRLEIAVAQGSAAQRLQAAVGTEVTVNAQEDGQGTGGL